MKGWEQWIESELDQLQAHAEILEANFYAALARNKEYAKFAPRIRRRARTLTIEWRSLHFVKGNPLHQSMARGRQAFRYGLGRFQKAADWERRAIDDFETSAEFVRRQCEALYKISQIADAYDKRRRSQVGYGEESARAKTS